MLTKSELESVLHPWAVALTGLAGDHVLWAKQDIPRPSLEYAVLDFVTLPRRDEGANDVSTLKPSASDDTAEIVGVRKAFTLSISAYGDSASDICNRAVTRIRWPGVDELLSKKASATMTVNDPVEAGDYAFSVNGFEYTYTAAGTETAEEVRDELTALLDADTSASGFDYEDSGADAILFSGHFLELSELSDTVTCATIQNGVELSVREIGSVNDLSFLNDNTWEPRCGFDVLFVYSDNEVVDNGAIEHSFSTGTIGTATITVEGEIE